MSGASRWLEACGNAAPTLATPATRIDNIHFFIRTLLPRVAVMAERRPFF
jgi:hypothetical protein